MMQPVSAWPPEREQTVRDRPPPNGSAGRGAASHSTIVRATARDWQPDSHGQTRNPRMSSISMRRLGDLVPIHAPGMNSSTERILRRMSDDDLLHTTMQPDDGELAKAHSGSNRLLDGNTRIIELQRRMRDPQSKIK